MAHSKKKKNKTNKQKQKQKRAMDEICDYSSTQ